MSEEIENPLLMKLDKNMDAFGVKLDNLIANFTRMEIARARSEVSMEVMFATVDKNQKDISVLQDLVGKHIHESITKEREQLKDEEARDRKFTTRLVIIGLIISGLQFLYQYFLRPPSM